MNLAIVNNSGNVGKSTLCQVLLKPRLNNSKIIKVETINSDGTDDEKFSSKEFDSILKIMDINDNSIIDVGSSNIETFLLQMNEYKDSHEDIDYFIIPIIPKHKQQIDAISTISMLTSMGMEVNRLRFIFNQADKTLSIEKQYPDFLLGLEALEITIEHYSIVYETEAFSMLNKLDKSFVEVTNDERDFRALLRNAKSREEREDLSEQRSIKRLINGVNDVLDRAFNALKLELI